ncbi:hypothetical protein FB192DRAFT_1341094 [Mucor lusitanicus]|uniref:Uncharacterized protein n=2 Tax=Mucor circinelloides f. lusitanicus TaxID=29924 RepID=A0A162RTT6_MUCCL|nr:hypothetical protein FB192DRAFT_1445300 [Mucor lusitanicus]KAF1803448.1 hypothetical protein FB192DRAFT_1341094 [Mucor lusitanicus]OAD08706.1 hypothetical protein MUCCIDRAFT_158895 [Mucor lusitanicus CBS 277.49]OAD08709.1 hypothetical protein MUCCIDRAFT_105678 [Mucor lusitanicus CBS 277.49]
MIGSVECINKVKKWKLATCLQYKQAILHLYPEHLRRYLADHPYLTALFRGLKDVSLLSYDFPGIDLQPALDFLVALGDNNQLTLLGLTRKLCFLLGTTGFLRPSDLERVDDARSIISHEPLSLKLVVVGPKERRAGRDLDEKFIEELKKLRKC